MMNRREFLTGLGLTTLTALLPQFALAKTLGFKGQRRLLILVELKGANDGLNTLIPYTEQAYYDARPNIALPESELYKLSSTLGLHPELAPLLPAWKQGQLAWVQGVGYAEPNRSHFESIEIWDNASKDNDEQATGWIAQSLADHQLGGIAIDTNLGPLYGEHFSALSISDPQRFANRGRDIKAAQTSRSSNHALQHILSVQSEVDMLANTLKSYLTDIPEPRQAFARNAFGRSLNSVYTLVASGITVPAYKISLGNFDTHVSQPHKHAHLLATLAEGLAALRINLQHLGMWDEAVLMTYSEFGRRVQENGSRGTDHGTAAPHLVIGGKVSGGWYGEYPSLKELDEKGDLYYTTDFRDMYATVRQNWWGLSGAMEAGQSLNFV